MTGYATSMGSSGISGARILGGNIFYAECGFMCDMLGCTVQFAESGAARVCIFWNRFCFHLLDTFNHFKPFYFLLKVHIFQCFCFVFKLCLGFNLFCTCMCTPTHTGSITPTVELNGLAMKRGEPAIYRPLDPKPMPNYRANYNFRGMFNQRWAPKNQPSQLVQL